MPELPGVPWVCFFEPNTGVALHGTYWHTNYGFADESTVASILKMKMCFHIDGQHRLQKLPAVQPTGMEPW